MVILSKGTINDYIQKEPNAAEALFDWYNETLKADWSNFAEMKRAFKSVDGVGNNRYVFNIKWNTYRLICVIHFNVRTVYIVFIGTHKEYDRVNAKMVKYKK